jgi:hypothetical protein
MRSAAANLSACHSAGAFFWLERQKMVGCLAHVVLPEQRGGDLLHLDERAVQVPVPALVGERERETSLLALDHQGLVDEDTLVLDERRAEHVGHADEVGQVDVDEVELEVPLEDVLDVDGRAHGLALLLGVLVQQLVGRALDLLLVQVGDLQLWNHLPPFFLVSSHSRNSAPVTFCSRARRNITGMSGSALISFSTSSGTRPASCISSSRLSSKHVGQCAERLLRGRARVEAVLDARQVRRRHADLVRRLAKAQVAGDAHALQSMSEFLSLDHFARSSRAAGPGGSVQ